MGLSWQGLACDRAGIYGAGMAAGLVFALSVMPLSLLAGHVPDSMLAGDITQNVVAQRYFIADAWRWPVLEIGNLGPAHDINLGLCDGIPLVAVPVKLLRAWLPPGFSAMYLWLAACFVAQPVAAIFALRGFGERRWAPALAVAGLALMAPCLLYRSGHIALCSHFLLWVALGVYARAAASSSLRVGRVFALLLISLLVHPYILAMVAGILLALPVTLAARRQLRWWPGLGFIAAYAAVAAIARGLGYDAPSPGGGYGQFSMNLISPVYPAYSSVWHALTGHYFQTYDPTGFQYEGYNYWGQGLILLMALVAAGTRGADYLTLGRRHAGLVLAAAGFTLFALSNVVYLGPYHVTLVARVPAALHQLRSGGRFFWPVTYGLILATVMQAVRLWGARRAAMVLALAVALQIADTAHLREAVAAHTHATGVAIVPDPPRTLHAGFMRGLAAESGGLASDAIDGRALAAILPHYTQLTIWPPVGCGQFSGHVPEYLPLLAAASDIAIPVNTMPQSRPPAHPDCDVASQVDADPPPGRLLVLMPEAADLAPHVPQSGQRCRALRTLTLCAPGLAAFMPSDHGASP